MTVCTLSIFVRVCNYSIWIICINFINSFILGTSFESGMVDWKIYAPIVVEDKMCIRPLQALGKTQYHHCIWVTVAPPGRGPLPQSIVDSIHQPSCRDGHHSPYTPGRQLKRLNRSWFRGRDPNGWWRNGDLASWPAWQLFEIVLMFSTLWSTPCWRAVPALKRGAEAWSYHRHHRCSCSTRTLVRCFKTERWSRNLIM